jgi:hypothetical protein
VLHGGDKTLIYERLGIIEKEDVDRFRRKFGIKKEIDHITHEDIDEAVLINRKSAKRSRLKRLKEQLERDEFKKVLDQYLDYVKKKEGMDEEELKESEYERNKIKERF